MSLKDTLTQKLEKQVESWETKLDSLRAQFNEYKAKAENHEATEELKEKTAKRIADLQEDIDAARAKLKEVRASGESHLNEVKGKVEDFLNRRS
ncbi:hypothetical protein [Salicola sp. Rm-C-2C1-2]|uniref:hypothetical protein n=1 Tax=Salicola sp. Rm-C-2C1-2 TaxID=3141321 RepID=UPI0032E4211A